MGTPQRPLRPSLRSAYACAAVASLVCLSACSVEPGTMAMFEARNADMQANPDYACVRATIALDRGVSEAQVDGLEVLAIRTCYESNQLERAEPIARARVERGIESSTALAVLGTLEWRRGELEPARDHLRRSLFVEHEGVAFNNLALVEWDLGQIAPALDYAQRAVDMLPDDVVIRSNLASFLAQTDRPDEAAPHVAYAGRLAPGESLGVYMPLAASYLRTNDPERLRPAIDALNEAIARRPADGYSRGLLSVAYGRTGDPGTAAQQLELALRLLGNDEESAIELALWLQLDRRYEDALRVLDDLEVHTGGVRLGATYAEVGEALLVARDAELAVQAFEGAVAAAEQSAEARPAEYRARLDHARSQLAKTAGAAGSAP